MSEKRSASQKREGPTSLPGASSEAGVAADRGEPENLQEQSADPASCESGTEPKESATEPNESSKDPDNPEGLAAGTEKAKASSTTSERSSPPQIPPDESSNQFYAGDSRGSSPLIGAVGGQGIGKVPNVDDAAGPSSGIRFLPLHSSALRYRESTRSCRREIESGKNEVFQRFFNERGEELYIPPHNRRRHKASRCRLDEGLPESPVHSPPGYNLLSQLQDINLPEPILNQAGAVIGWKRTGAEPLDSNGNPLSGYAAQSEHSIGSAETVRIGDVYAHNFSPRPPSNLSDRGLESGMSIPYSEQEHWRENPENNEEHRISPEQGQGAENDQRIPPELEHGAGNNEQRITPEHGPLDDDLLRAHGQVPKNDDIPHRTSPVYGRETGARAKEGVSRRRPHPVSTDSDSSAAPMEAAQIRPVFRRKRSTASRPIDVPQRCDSALADAEDSPSDERDYSRSRQSAGTGPRRKISQDSTDSMEVAGAVAPKDSKSSARPKQKMRPEAAANSSSEDDATYPELSVSMRSSDDSPTPDVAEMPEGVRTQDFSGVKESLFGQERQPTQTPPSEELLTEEESESSEQDPITVMSCSPDPSMNPEQDPPAEN